MGKTTALVVLTFVFVLAWAGTASASASAVPRKAVGPGAANERRVEAPGRQEPEREPSVRPESPEWPNREGQPHPQERQSGKAAAARSGSRHTVDRPSAPPADVGHEPPPAAAAPRVQPGQPARPPQSTTTTEPEHVVHGDDASVLAPAVHVDAPPPPPTHDVAVLGEQFERPAPDPAALGGRLASTGPATPVATTDLLAIALALVSVGAALQAQQRYKPARAGPPTGPGSWRETTPLTPGRTSKRGRSRLPL